MKSSSRDKIPDPLNNLRNLHDQAWNGSGAAVVGIFHLSAAVPVI